MKARLHTMYRRAQPLTTNDNGVIVMATNSLPRDKLTEFRPISVSAFHVLARMAARKAVQEQLRSQGVRVSLVKPAEISVKAQVYLSQHPELYREALERAQRLGMYEKPKRRSVA